MKVADTLRVFAPPPATAKGRAAAVTRAHVRLVRARISLAAAQTRTAAARDVVARARQALAVARADHRLLTPSPKRPRAANTEPITPSRRQRAKTKRRT